MMKLLQKMMQFTLQYDLNIRKPTSMVQLLFNLVLFPCSNGTPSMNSGRFPSFAMKKSPLLRNLIVP